MICRITGSNINPRVSNPIWMSSRVESMVKILNALEKPNVNNILDPEVITAPNAYRIIDFLF